MNEKWTERFVELAAHIAQWSKDPSLQVGAVIIRPDRTVASVGFNGLPRGVEDDAERLDDRDTKLRYTVHAELNAILAAKEPLNGYSIVVYPIQPCAQCAAAIIQAGISEVICPRISTSSACPSNVSTAPTRWGASFEAACSMFHEAGIMVRWV